jgi:hypothetical protein
MPRSQSQRLRTFSARQRPDRPQIGLQAWSFRAIRVSTPHSPLPQLVTRNSQLPLQRSHPHSAPQRFREPSRGARNGPPGSHLLSAPPPVPAGDFVHVLSVRASPGRGPNSYRSHRSYPSHPVRPSSPPTSRSSALPSAFSPPFSASAIPTSATPTPASTTCEQQFTEIYRFLVLHFARLTVL